MHIRVLFYFHFCLVLFCLAFFFFVFQVDEMLPAAHNEGKRSMFQKRESGNQFPAETDEKSHVYIVQPKW